MKKIYDVVVVGSGPASAAFLYEVADSYSVAVISKKAFRKVCGGLLSPTSIKVLSDMGLTIPKSLYVTPELHVIRTIDLRDGLVRYYPRSYANIDRCLFDSWLMSLVSGKYDLYNGVCTGFEKVDGLYRVSFTENGEKKFLVCRSIIGCDGASSVVRKCITGEKHRKDIYIAIQQWFKASECEGQESENAFSCIFDNVSTDSYTWSFRKGDRIAFGGAYPKENSLKRFESEKMKLSDYGIFFRNTFVYRGLYCCIRKKETKISIGYENRKNLSCRRICRTYQSEFFGRNQLGSRKRSESWENLYHRKKYYQYLFKKNVSSKDKIAIEIFKIYYIMFSDIKMFCYEKRLIIRIEEKNQ